jgi:hypothetical protein
MVMQRYAFPIFMVSAGLLLFRDAALIVLR